MMVKGITIHNTGNTLTALQNYKMLKDGGRLDACHFLIDDKKIVNTWDENEPAYHTGKGYDLGNMNTIAIEICFSKRDLKQYLKAEEKAMGFVKELLDKYELNSSCIYFHRDFNHTSNCPHRILEIYGDKKSFIRKYFEEGLDV